MARPDHQHRRPLAWALTLTAGFALVEAIAGWWANSLALTGDAGHMFTDATALGLAALAAWASRLPASRRHTYGFARAELVAAFVNSLFMLGIVAAIALAAFQRLTTPLPVAGPAVTAVAVFGLVINLLVARLLHDDHGDLNQRAAFLHVLGDLLGSVAAVAAGLIVTFTGWTRADPVLSLLICVLILISSLSLVRQALHGLLDGIPPALELAEIGGALAAVPGVASIHDLHVWSLNSRRTVLTAHVVVTSLEDWPRVLAELRTLAHDRFDISHATFQPEAATQTVSFRPRQ